jgi:uncharacterized cupin superfamily protein
MPKLDLAAIPQTNATGYPPHYAGEVQGRWYRRLAPAGGLADFGASHVELQPGAWSAHRHWHEDEDEMVVMLAGEAVLVDDHGEHVMLPGDIAVSPRMMATAMCSRTGRISLAPSSPSDDRRRATATIPISTCT